jgi:hypothetical protein
MGLWKFIEQLWKGGFQATRALSKMLRVLIFKLFLPSYNYLRYLCHVQIFLGL